MAIDQVDAKVSLMYCIAQAACTFKQAWIRQAAVRWLRQSHRHPTGDLLIRLKLAELEELCSKYDDWFKEIDRMIDLYDFLAPKDSDQTSFKSPWFYFRNVIIVGAAVQGYDDEACIASCSRHLLQFPSADNTTDDFAKKQDHMQRLAEELAAYNGVRDPFDLKTKYPLIYQFLKDDPDSQLMSFLESFHSALDPDNCFLKSAAAQVQASEKSDSAIELSSESQRLGHKLLLEQFQDCERTLGESALNPEEDAEVPCHLSDQPEVTQAGLLRKASPAKDKRRANRESRSRARSGSESGSEHDGRKRKRSLDKTKQAQRSGDDRPREGNGSARRSSKMNRSETLQQFKLKRRSLLRAADKIPDARERANATARKIQDALAQGKYERWSDNEDEDGCSEDNAEDHIRRESRSRSPRPVHRHALPDDQSRLHPSGARRLSLGLAAVPSPVLSDRRQVRRSVGAWQEYEIEALRAGVTSFGVGQWSQILKHGRFMAGRTSVDLKDKYRNMVKKGLFEV